MHLSRQCSKLLTKGEKCLTEDSTTITMRRTVGGVRAGFFVVAMGNQRGLASRGAGRLRDLTCTALLQGLLGDGLDKRRSDLQQGVREDPGYATRL